MKNLWVEPGVGYGKGRVGESLHVHHAKIVLPLALLQQACQKM